MLLPNQFDNKLSGQLYLGLKLIEDKFFFGERLAMDHNLPSFFGGKS